MAYRLDDTTGDEEKKAKNRLRDLEVPDVDIVDRPAIRRKFLIVKREDGMPGEAEGSEFSTGDITVDLAADPESGTETPADDTPAAPATDDAGTTPGPTADDAGTAPTATAPAATPATTDDQTPEAIAKAEREKVKKAAEAHAALLAEKIQAIQKIADEIRTGAGTMDAKELKAKIRQLESLGWKIDDPANVVNVLKSEGAGAEEVAKAIPVPVRDAVVRALREAAERLMSVNVALRAATVTQDKVAAPLPDSVAREIKAIKALVRSVLQRYPYPSPSGAAKAEAGDEGADASPDDTGGSQDTGTTEQGTEPLEVGFETAHEMMKQAAALTLPAAVRDAVSAKVRGATELLLSIVAAVTKMQTTEERLPSPLPAETATAIGKALGIFDEILKKYPAPAAKSDDAMAALNKHFEAIKGIVTELAKDGGAIVVKETDGDSKGGEGGKPTPVEDPRIGELMKKVEANTELIKKMAGTPGASNALADEGRETVAKGEGEEVDWGFDLSPQN